MDKYACEIGTYDSERGKAIGSSSSARKSPDLGIRATPKHNKKLATLCFEYM